MSKRGAATALLTPTPSGWRLGGGVHPPREAATMAELVPHIPAGTRVELSLPCFSALLERLALPSTDGEELTGMIQLHLESTLPYPVEEVTSGYVVVQQGETESTVLSIAVHSPVLAELCQPLREAERPPVTISLFALDVAAHLPTGERVAAVWAEQAHLAIGIYERGKLAWAYNLVGTDAASLATDLPPLLLTAEMEGVPTKVEQVTLASDCAEMRETLAEIFEVPIGTFAVAEVRPQHVLDFLPPEWALAEQAVARKERLQQRLLLGAVIYLLLVAVAFVYLAWMKRQVQVLDDQIAQIQPTIQATLQRQARWTSLEPALETKYFPIEVLFLLNRNRPEAVHITNFEANPERFKVDGEAPNHGLTIDFAEKLRSDKDLRGFQIEAGPPNLLPDGKAQFVISGKLLASGKP